jgi:hypothetical protein
MQKRVDSCSTTVPPGRPGQSIAGRTAKCLCLGSPGIACSRMGHCRRPAYGRIHLKNIFGNWASPTAPRRPPWRSPAAWSTSSDRRSELDRGPQCRLPPLSVRCLRLFDQLPLPVRDGQLQPTGLFDSLADRAPCGFQHRALLECLTSQVDPASRLRLSAPSLLCLQTRWELSVVGGIPDTGTLLIPPSGGSALLGGLPPPKQGC